MADLLAPLELAELERMLGGDDELRTRLEGLLAEHGIAADALAIEVSGGRMRLSGSVTDPVTALLIEDLAWSLPQVCRCENALCVHPAAPGPRDLAA